MTTRGHGTPLSSLIGAAFGLAVAAASAQQVQTAQLAPTPKIESFVSTLSEATAMEAPKLVSTLLAAVFAAWLALRVTSRVTASWDLRKKRAEFDIMLGKEFYKVVGDFKAVARDWQALGAQPRPANTIATWREKHAAMISRAIAAESDMEAILLKLVSEISGEENVSILERERRFHAAGLMRAAFRNLREAIEQRDTDLPGYGEAEFWLFNRIAGEMSKVVYGRAAHAPRKADSPPPDTYAKEYLRILAYRTSDLQASAARLIPDLIRYFDARDTIRTAARTENVGRLFAVSSWEIVPPATPGTAYAPLRQATLLAVALGPRLTEDARNSMARQLFAANQSLLHCLTFADDPAHIVIIDRAMAVSTHMPEQQLPETLPFRTAVRVYAATLLAWELKGDALEALHRVATVPIHPQ
jgi:hypothetical protein